MIVLRSKAWAVLAACTLGFPIAAASQAKEPGDQWEVTTEMAMQGMKMPGQTTKVCSPRNREAVPVGDNDGKCDMYDVKRSGATTTWKMRCAGDPPTTGSGEMTYQGPDRYAGKMSMSVGKDTMAMNLSGRKLGACDAGEAKRQVAALQQQATAMQAQSAQAMAQVCEKAASDMTPQMLKPDTGLKCDPKYKADFCKRLQDNTGFAKVAARAARPDGGSDLADAGKLCGVNPEEMRERMCRRAESEESLDFLANACIGYGTPGWGSKIAARECTGRDFTSPPVAKYRGFCSAYARRGLMKPELADQKDAAGAADGPAKTEKKPVDEAINKGKDLIKGLFR